MPKKTHIVVVEDSLALTYTLFQVWNPPPNGYHVQVYDSGEAALKQLCQAHVDLLISDYNLSDMTGLELLKRVRQVSADTRSILIAPSDYLQMPERACLLADACLPKPVTMPELMATISRVLDGKSTLATTPPGHSADYEPLSDLIASRTGIALNENRREDMVRVVENLIASGKATDVRSLTLALTHNPHTHSIWQAVLQAVTVGETYFFRNQAHFNALRSAILPALIAARRDTGRKHLRFWSAGCASGEEPYSLAMLLRELLPDIETWQITILGTDIDHASLEHAKRGIYRDWSFRSETPGDIRERWFTPTSGGYELDRSIREMVAFAPLNLVANDYPSFESNTMNMDLILCRNVTIYFSEKVTREIAGRFYQALNDKGWLIVGHSEPLATVYQGFAARNLENAVFYQKCTSPAPASQQPAAESRPRPDTTPPSVPAPPTVAVKRPEPRPAVARPQPQQATRQVGDVWQRAQEAADRESWEEALAWLAKLEQEDSLQPQVHYLRALIQLQTEDPDGAFLSLRQAIYCDPDFALAHYALGDLYEKLRERRQAARHWRSAQRALEGLDPQQRLPLTDDLTVEMLRGLLAHRLTALTTSSEVDDVHL